MTAQPKQPDAELIAADGTRFPLAAGDLLVGRATADGAPVPDIDLVSVRGGRTVSRRHARIFRSVGAWHLQCEPSARNLTIVAGQKLAPGQHAVLQDGHEITLGKVSLVFRARREIAPSDPLATLVGPQHASAEIRCGDSAIPLLVAEGRTLRIGRRSDDRRYYPDVDFADVPGGRTVSRQHAELAVRDHTWYMSVQADVTNPTYLNGMLLERGQEVELSDGDRLRLGRVEATFHVDKVVRYVDSDVLDLTLGPPTDPTVEAGSQQIVPLSLVNFSGRVDWFHFALSGIPSDWYRIRLATTDEDQPPVVRLLTGPPPVPTPESTARATLTLAPPRQAHARAGIYPILVSATSQGEDHLRRTVSGQVTVLPFFDLRMAANRADLHGRRAASDLTVTNNGNAPLEVALTCVADKNLDVRLEHEKFLIENGASSRIAAHLRVKRRHWFGIARTAEATLTASANAAVAQQQLKLTCPPIIPLWLQRILGFIKSIFKPILVPIAILAVALGVAYFLLRPPDIALSTARDLVGKGDTATLRWNVDRARANATLETPDGPREVALNVDAFETPPLLQTQDFKLNAGNWFGIVGTRNVRVRVVRVLSLTPSTLIIKQPGEPVTFEWKTENASSVRLESPDETLTSLPSEGSVVVHPTKSTRYELVASDASGHATDRWPVAIAFGNAEISKFEADKPHVHAGDVLTLTWTAAGFSKLTLLSDTDDLNLSAEADVSRQTFLKVRPLHTGKYHLAAVNPDNAPLDAFVDVVVEPLPAPHLQAPSRLVSAGDPVTLTWQAEGANDRTALSIDQSVGDVTGLASIDVRPLQTTTYRLTMTGADGQKITSDPATVTVIPAVKEFKAEPAAITESAPVSLKWTVVDADAVTIVRDDGVSFDGQVPDGVILDHPPASVTSYQLKARNASGESSSVAKIVVTPAPRPSPMPAPGLKPSPSPSPAAT